MIRTIPRSGVDFYSGLLLVSAAALGLWLVSDLDLGSANDMGPAYFPAAIALALGAIGLLMLIRGLTLAGPAVGRIELRPLVCVLGALLAFGILVTRAGLIAAILAQVAIAHFASAETKLAESILLGLAVAGFSSVVFVHLLALPVSLLP